jgi:anti-anti-sigma factor
MQEQIFLIEFENCISKDRPCIVLDCSQVHQIDRSGTYLLLRCLEEAMKRNGDVRLAEVHVEVRAVLTLTGLDRIFEIFDANADAVKSFLQPPLYAVSRMCAP